MIVVLCANSEKINMGVVTNNKIVQLYLRIARKIRDNI